MTAIAAWSDNLEDGADTDPVDTSNSIFDALTGSGTSVFTATDPFEGTLAVQVDTAAANRSLEKTSTARARAWQGFALKITTTPSATAAVFNTYLAGVLVGNLRLTTSRTLNFRDSATSRYTSPALTLGAWYEVRVLTDPAADVARVKIYDAAGALVNDSGNLTLSNAAAATFDEIRLGLLSGGGTGGITLDRLLADDTDEPAPLASTPTPYLYYDNGTTWEDVSSGLYYDNGTTWVQVEAGVPAP